jgi:CheY-like chemotaxis protein
VKSALRILTVEDDPAVAFALRAVLERPDRSLSCASTGREALEMTGANAFDLVITDNYMPEIGGLELTRRLRQQNFSGKILVLSGDVSQEKRQAYTDLGVDGIVEKPFDIHALNLAIDEIANAPTADTRG